MKVARTVWRGQGRREPPALPYAKVMPNFGELGKGLGTGQINRNWTKER